MQICNHFFYAPDTEIDISEPAVRPPVDPVRDAQALEEALVVRHHHQRARPRLQHRFQRLDARRSRWLVGSSSSSRRGAGSRSTAHSSAPRIRSPPLRLSAGRSTRSGLRPASARYWRSRPSSCRVATARSWSSRLRAGSSSARCWSSSTRGQACGSGPQRRDLARDGAQQGRLAAAVRPADGDPRRAVRAPVQRLARAPVAPPGLPAPARPGPPGSAGPASGKPGRANAPSSASKASCTSCCRSWRRCAWRSARAPSVCWARWRQGVQDDPRLAAGRFARAPRALLRAARSAR